MRVVVVGGGYGGIKAALELANNPNFKVTLISDSPNFTYTSALYRTVTGTSPLETVIPLREIFEDDNVTVELDRITEINNRLKTVTSYTGNTYKYDKLVLALGATTNYFGIAGLEEHSLSMKSVPDALKLRKHLHEGLGSFKGQNVQYAVVGAGATGVELASELTFYVKKLCHLHSIDNAKFTVNLIEAADRILPNMPQEFTNKVEKRLANLGVNIYTNTAVEGGSTQSLNLPDDDIKTTTIVWTAGVANNPFYKEHEHIFKLSKKGRVKVNNYLEASPEIYVIGDNAETEYSGMAQTALYDAKFVADNLKRYKDDYQLKDYLPKKPAYAIPVGQNWAAVAVGNSLFFGYMGWIIRRAADFRLLDNFLPFKVAVKKWLKGTQRAHIPCPVCSFMELGS